MARKNWAELTCPTKYKYSCMAFILFIWNIVIIVVSYFGGVGGCGLWNVSLSVALLSVSVLEIELWTVRGPGGCVIRAGFGDWTWFWVSGSLLWLSFWVAHTPILVFLGKNSKFKIERSLGNFYPVVHPKTSMTAGIVQTQIVLSACLPGWGACLNYGLCRKKVLD